MNVSSGCDMTMFVDIQISSVIRGTVFASGGLSQRSLLYPHIYIKMRLIFNVVTFENFTGCFDSPNEMMSSELINTEYKVLSNIVRHYFDGLVQDCSISIANALEILQFCTKPSILCMLRAIFSLYPQKQGQGKVVPAYGGKNLLTSFTTNTRYVKVLN